MTHSSLEPICSRIYTQEGNKQMLTDRHIHCLPYIRPDTVMFELDPFQMYAQISTDESEDSQK